MGLDIFLILAALCTLNAGEVAGGVASCQDVDTSACALFQQQKADMCSDPSLANVCQRFCGLCPLTCYQCAGPVRDVTSCTTVQTCNANETCLLKELRSSIDGHHEYIMMCEDKMVCEGAGNGFLLIGKRSAANIQSRDLSISCCDNDLCNKPPTIQTTMPTAPPPTITTTTAPGPISTSANNCARDIAFVVDESSTVSQNDFDLMVDFIEMIVNQLVIGRDDTRVAFLGFSTDSKVEFFLNEHYTRAGVISDLRTLDPFHGQTHTELALEDVRTDVFQEDAGDRRNVPNVVIVITDGQSTVKAETAQQVGLLHKISTDVIVLGVSDNYDYMAEWKLIASDRKHVVQVDDYDDLTYALGDLLFLICS